MSKLVESTFVSLDGVIANPQHWGPPYWDDQHSAYAVKLLEPADALLLGRDTYEAFAQAWPARSGDPYGRCRTLTPPGTPRSSKAMQPKVWPS